MYGTYLSQLLHGLAVTAEITIFAAVLATLLAVMGGVGLASTNFFLRGASRVYVEIFRGTSLLVQLFWIYYVLPSFGLSLDPFAAGVAAIALNGGAYGAEAVRGAIQTLPRGQWEAAKALGLPRRVTLHKVILPQACIFLLPQWGNFLIESMKATAVVSFISITDLSFVGYQINMRTFDTITVYGLVLLIYFAFSQIIIVPARAAERRYRLRGINTASRAERAA